jgi:hypothetical protein
MMDRSRRNGVALATALMCVVLLGAVIAGAFVAAAEETRMSANSVSDGTALGAAESAAEGQLARWNGQSADSIPIGAIRPVAVASAPLPSTTWLVRLDSTVFWIIAEARGADQISGHPVVIRQRVSLLIRTVRDSSGLTSAHPLDQRAWALIY